MSKKGREQASRMIEDAVAKEAARIQADKKLSDARKNELLAKNAKAADAARRKMGTD